MSEDKYKEHFPEWVQRIFNKNMTCTECKAPLTTDGIGSIGLYCSGFLLDDFIRPLCGIEVDCANCGQTTRITAGDNLFDLFKAIECFYEIIASTRMGREPDDPKLPSPNDTPRDQPEAPDAIRRRFGGRFGDVVNGEFGDRAKKRRWQKRRSLHKPISDEEVARFLRRLERTSWNRSTKSFRKFMGEFGIDAGKGGEA